MNWVNWLNQEKRKSYFIDLQTKLHQAYKNNNCLPLNRQNVFRALNLTPINNVKIVILGQDPYPNPWHATGLAFSVNKNQKLPASLVNIFHALRYDYPNIILKHGDLTAWAKQGVLLLNTCLTVAPYQPFSHQNWNWDQFIVNLLKMLNDLNQPIAFLLWGKSAQKYKIYLRNKHHLILETSHPSPLSAYRGFLNANHFIKVNQFLIKHNISPLDWNLY